MSRFNSNTKAGRMPGFSVTAKFWSWPRHLPETAQSLLLICLAMLLSACASLDPDYEQPFVTLASFKALPSEGMVPEFEAVLRVTNPNAEPINVEGIVYTIAVEDRELIKSVGKGFEPIEGYSEGTLTVRGSVSLIQGVRLLTSLMDNSDGTLDYEFRAKLDLDGFNPTVRVSETGTLDLSGRASQ